MSPRNFAILALATVASIALAAHAVSQRDTPLRVEAAGEAMFPELLDRLNDVHEIRITMPAGKLTVTATDQGWSLAEKAGYPIDPAKVRDLALALANLQLVEAKTADPKRLERLELGEPGADGATSRLVELLGGDGATLAAAVVGKASPSLYGGGRGGVYVRRAARPSGLARRRRAGSAGRCHDADRQRACRRAAGSGGPRGCAATGRGGRDVVAARRRRPTSSPTQPCRRAASSTR